MPLLLLPMAAKPALYLCWVVNSSSPSRRSRLFPIHLGCGARNSFTTQIYRGVLSLSFPCLNGSGGYWVCPLQATYGFYSAGKRVSRGFLPSTSGRLTPSRPAPLKETHSSLALAPSLPRGHPVELHVEDCNSTTIFCNSTSITILKILQVRESSHCVCSPRAWGPHSRASLHSILQAIKHFKMLLVLLLPMASHVEDLSPCPKKPGFARKLPCNLNSLVDSKKVSSSGFFFLLW